MKPKKELILSEHPNGIVVKIDNKRIVIARAGEDSNMLQFKKLMEKSDFGKNTSFAAIVKNKIAITEIGLSDDGLLLLQYAIDQYLKRKK